MLSLRIDHALIKILFDLNSTHIHKCNSLSSLYNYETYIYTPHTQTTYTHPQEVPAKQWNSITRENITQHTQPKYIFEYKFLV